MDKTTQVYCTNCFYGYQLLEVLYYNNDIMIFPENCRLCYPWNPEDSVEYDLRKFYVERDNNK